MKAKQIVMAALLILGATSAEAYCRDSKARQFLSDSETVTASAETDKYYWLGTNHGLVFVRKRDEKVFRLNTRNSALKSDSVVCIATKCNGEVFIGTRNGLLRYDNFTFLLLTTENSPLRSNNITSLASVNGVEMLAGTSGGGITAFHETYTKTYTTENASLPGNSVLAFQQVSADSMVAIFPGNNLITIKNTQVCPVK